MAKVPVPITPAVLAWAREEAGLSVAELADEIGASVDDVRSWESGEDSPGKGQFAQICNKLNRPRSAFFLPTPPKATSALPSFRRTVEATEHRGLRRYERVAVREGQRIQKTLRWVSKETEQGRSSLPDARDLKPVAAARTVRKWLGWTASEQTSSRNAQEAISRFRKCLHRAGVVVMNKPLGEGGVQGFALWDEYAPLICINTAQMNEVRLFTMAHELGHLARRDSAISTGRLTDGADEVERWCEEFAAAFLLPKADVLAQLDRKGLVNVTSMPQVESLSKTFRVSLRAMAIRLITLGRANWGLYRQIQRVAEFKPRVAPDKPPQRSRVTIRLHEFGDLYAARLTNAEDRGVLGRYDVAEYLDIRQGDVDKLRAALASVDS